MVEIVTPKPQASGSGKRTVREDDFLAYSDDEEEEVGDAIATPPISMMSAETELQLYLLTY